MGGIVEGVETCTVPSTRAPVRITHSGLVPPPVVVRRAHGSRPRRAHGAGYTDGPPAPPGSRPDGQSDRLACPDHGFRGPYRARRTGRYWSRLSLVVSPGAWAGGVCETLVGSSSSTVGPGCTSSSQRCHTPCALSRYSLRIASDAVSAGWTMSGYILTVWQTAARPRHCSSSVPMISWNCTVVNRSARGGTWLNGSGISRGSHGSSTTTRGVDMAGPPFPGAQAGPRRGGRRSRHPTAPCLRAALAGGGGSW